MHGKLLLIIVLLTVPLLLGGGILVWNRAGESRELDRLIAALPERSAPRPVPFTLSPETRRALASARLIELFEEASRFGVSGALGARSRGSARRSAILTELEERLADNGLEPADQRTLGEVLRADLARDPNWSGTLRNYRLAWLRWLATLRKGAEFDENQVLGPPIEFRRLLGGRRITDGAIILGWRAIERFYDRIEKVPLTREDFGIALDACVEVPPTRGKDPVTAYFAKYATRDLKSTQKRLMEFRSREEKLLQTLE